ncbi:hypothetical protein K2X30_06655 [bacterium]|jgi:ribosomal protein L6P/L9E|nr:hypothetical protein [bacterium]
MKKSILLVALMFAAPAMADIPNKNAVTVNGADAENVYQKIVDVTKQRPKNDRHGRATVSASATVTCKQHGSPKDVACIVSVNK